MLANKGVLVALTLGFRYVYRAARRRHASPALLTPLVENAVKHGVLPREDGGSISVIASVDGGRVRLSVADDGPGLDGAITKRGTGLTNTESRLTELYGERARLVLAQTLDRDGLTATVELSTGSRRLATT